MLEVSTKRQLLTPTDIGKLVGLSARQVNDLLASVGFQYKVAGKWDPLEPGMPYAVMMDTGKKHSNGTPIRQLKWETPIVEEVKKLMPSK